VFPFEANREDRSTPARPLRRQVKGAPSRLKLTSRGIKQMSTKTIQVALSESSQEQLRAEHERALIIALNLGQTMAENGRLREYVKKLERKVDRLGGKA
jgi:hypothetical protein